MVLKYICWNGIQLVLDGFEETGRRWFYWKLKTVLEWVEDGLVAGNGLKMVEDEGLKIVIKKDFSKRFEGFWIE